ncbi:hypothetical protein Hdeb2414_s0188g00827531 [Helianthus debilis subsp. tardiflorus]
MLILFKHLFTHFKAYKNFNVIFDYKQSIIRFKVEHIQAQDNRLRSAICSYW